MSALVNRDELSDREKARARARDMSNVYEHLVRAYADAAKNKGISQQVIADRLGMNKSRVSRIMRGDSKNLTIRTLSELALALEKNLIVDLVDPPVSTGSNYRFDPFEENSEESLRLAIKVNDSRVAIKQSGVGEGSLSGATQVAELRSKEKTY